MNSTNTYVLDSSEAELERLLRVAGLLGPIAVSALRQAGLGPGDRALDLGCGPLGALASLHEVVGTTGTVVGVDASADALATAQRALDRLGIRTVSLVEADINQLEPAQVGGDDFDLAFCRLVLMHQSDPAATLARIAGLLRPGGHLVAYDFFAAPHVEPRIGVVDRAWELIIGAMQARGASPDVSRRYRDTCAAAGFEVVSERGTFIPMPLPAVITETTLLLSGVRRGVEAAGLAPAAEIDELLAAVQAHAGDQRAAWSPTTVELIARNRG
jgi:SAM-dependent methyltransferase